MSVTEKIIKHVETELKLSDCVDCFAVPNSDSMIDVIHPATGKTLIYGKTLEECRAEKGYEKAELMSIDVFCQMKARRQDTDITWSETTEEKYDEMLCVLPPALYVDAGFLVGEPWDHHSLTGQPRFQAFRAQFGKYYVASRPMTRAEFKKACEGKI